MQPLSLYLYYNDRNEPHNVLLSAKMLLTAHASARKPSLYLPGIDVGSAAWSVQAEWDISRVGLIPRGILNGVGLDTSSKLHSGAQVCRLREQM